MKKFGFIKKTTMITLAIASTVIFTISAGAVVDYSSNINYTGGYDCSPNTNGAITISKEKIGVMAYKINKTIYIRATTTNGAITYESFTATFKNPKTCDENGQFKSTILSGEYVALGDVETYKKWFFGEDNVRIINTNAKINETEQIFTKPYSRHYY